MVAQHLGERGQIEARLPVTPARHAAEHLRAPVQHHGLGRREEAEPDGLLEHLLELRDGMGAHACTAPSRKVSSAAPASSCTRVPRATG